MRNNINDLTLHEVDCKGNPITMIEHDFSNGQFKYNYACSNNNLTDLKNYQTNVKIKKLLSNESSLSI